MINVLSFVKYIVESHHAYFEWGKHISGVLGVYVNNNCRLQFSYIIVRKTIIEVQKIIIYI